jgi:hypothetical protein
MENNERIIPVDIEYLTNLLRDVLGRQSLQIGEWEVQRLQGGLEYGSTIYRLGGAIEAGGEVQPWSLILKTIQPVEEFDDPQGYRYWKREIQAYQSGILQELPGQVSAPRCYDVQEKPDGSVWLWLEDVHDELEHPWSIEQYARVAHLLGEFNGAYLAGRPLPNDPWVSHDWLRKYLVHAAPMAAFIRQNPAHPTVQLMLPGIILPMTLASWDEHPSMLRVLDGLPQTFCHQDAFGRNLFFRREQVIAIDWGYAGLAPVGAELAPLIGAAFGLARFPSSQAKELDQACFSGYLEGLRQAGWEPDPRQVRLSYTVTMTLRYVLGATVGEMLPGLLDERTRLHWVEGLESTPEKAGESDAGIVAYYQSIFMEALKLLGLGSLLRFLGRTGFYTLRLVGKRRGNPSGKPIESGNV